MSVVFSLIRKNLLDSRWLLVICGSALFGLCWVFVFVAHRIEVEIQEARLGPRSMGMLRGLGGSSMDFSTAAIEMAFWNHPFVLLIFSIWAISRGSIAVAGEIEKGTMDLVLSRPVGRSSFLVAQVVTALGRVAPDGRLDDGRQPGGEPLQHPDRPGDGRHLTKPALNLVAFGWAIFGYTFVLSTLDFARWRPNLIASVATLAGFIALILSNHPPARHEVAREALDLQGLRPGRGRHQGPEPTVQRRPAGPHRRDRGGPRLPHLLATRPPRRELDRCQSS